MSATHALDLSNDGIEFATQERDNVEKLRALGGRPPLSRKQPTRRIQPPGQTGNLIVGNSQVGRVMAGQA